MNQSEQIINIVSRWGFKPNELEKITSGNTYTQVYLLSDPASKRLFCFRGNKGNKQSKGNQVTFVHAVQNYLFNSRLIESRAIRNGEGESWLEEEGYLWELLSWAKGEAVMRDQLNTLQTTDYYNLGVYVGQIHNKLYSFTKEKEITKTPLLDLPYENMILFEQENAKNLIAESVGELLTLEEYNELTPLEKGFAHYMQSNWKESPIPEETPYKEGTKEYEDFNDGGFRAMIAAQNFED